MPARYRTDRDDLWFSCPWATTSSSSVSCLTIALTGRPSHFQGAVTSMPKRDLVAPWDVGMRPQQDRRALTLIPNGRDKRLHFIVFANAIGNERRVDEIGVDLDEQITGFDLFLRLSKIGCHRLERFTHGADQADPSRIGLRMPRRRCCAAVLDGAIRCSRRFCAPSSVAPSLFD